MINKYIKRGNGKSKVMCEECKKIKRVRTLIRFKGKVLCYTCRKKLDGSMQSANTINHPYITLEEALSRTYECRRYTSNNKSHVVIQIPSVLAEKKVRLVIVE